MIVETVDLIIGFILGAFAQLWFKILNKAQALLKAFIKNQKNKNSKTKNKNTPPANVPTITQEQLDSLKVLLESTNLSKNDKKIDEKQSVIDSFKED